MKRFTLENVLSTSELIELVYYSLRES